MKVAIVHDWLVTNAGAEKVLRNIINIYPDAEIFSLVNFLSPEERDIIIDVKKVHTSFIQKLPYAKKHFRSYLPLFPKAIESFDLSAYDLIISSSWAVAKGVKKSPDQLHVCYCHTPIRYAWDLNCEYTENLPYVKKILVQNILKYIRKWDIDTLDRVDHFIANSTFVQERILRIYNRESTVIHPPVDINKFTLYEEKEDFYLTASRLVPYKKIKLIVEAFNKMPDKKLVVIGGGEEYDYIKKIAKDNISVLGYQSDKILITTMQKAKGFIFAATEDFGIIPVEAMACGTPIIAYGKGGIKDTVVDGITGIFFDEQNTVSLNNAIETFETIRFDYQSISKHTSEFSTERFEKEMKEFLKEKWKKDR